ncbi:hypothetical protein DN730_09705 [Marinomonas piezotolerans]|uniref:Uncharacterized protein n=1 Tax=Marinomonas piezotolerans TaxID=2213058 RepID=A0A370UA62_9GAMM|nr:hypothetical protein [Marinomonas piezotolerans]RDL44650.1 hypothetical protein DN730_09705 [Marinomonas piezotolerans]
MPKNRKPSDEEVQKGIEKAIENGLGIFKTAQFIKVGVARMKRLATKEQLKALKRNGEANLNEVKQQSEERIKARIEESLRLGHSLTACSLHAGASTTRVRELATPSQIKALESNNKADKKTFTPTRNEGGIVIRDQAIARMRMQEIIAAHRAIGRRHV